MVNHSQIIDLFRQTPTNPNHHASFVFLPATGWHIQQHTHDTRHAPTGPLRARPTAPATPTPPQYKSR